jgi:hypothetical protein
LEFIDFKAKISARRHHGSNYEYVEIGLGRGSDFAVLQYHGESGFGEDRCNKGLFAIIPVTALPALLQSLKSVNGVELRYDGMPGDLLEIIVRLGGCGSK